MSNKILSEVCLEVMNTLWHTDVAAETDKFKNVLQIPNNIRRFRTTPDNTVWQNDAAAQIEKVSYGQSIQHTPNNIRCFKGHIDQLTEVAVKTVRVAVVGASGSGKATLINKFIGNQTGGRLQPSYDTVRSVTVSHGDSVTTLTFPHSSFLTPEADVYLVVFSVSDMISFNYAVSILHYMHMDQRFRHKVVMLVANKVDLKRTCVIPRTSSIPFAYLYGIKYVETSSVIDYNINKVLVGITRQVVLKQRGGGMLRTRVKKAALKKVKVFADLMHIESRYIMRSLCENLSC